MLELYRVAGNVDHHLMQRLEEKCQNKGTSGSGTKHAKISDNELNAHLLCLLACLPCANALRVQSSRQAVEPVNLIRSSWRTSAPLCKRFTAPYVFSIQIYLVRGSLRPLRDP